MSFGTGVKALIDASGAWAKNHSPELLLAGGIISLVGAVVMSAKAGSNTEEILEGHKAELDDVKSEEIVKKSDVVKIYAQTTGYLAKEYAPAVVLTSLSITCFCASYGILKSRYVALGAAYTALEESYRKYRERVIADRGEEADKYYLTGEKPKTITVEGEDGKKEKIKVYPTLPDGSIASPYAFKFGKYKENGERNNQWQNDRKYCMMYILGQQDYLNDQLYLRCKFNDEHEVIQRGSVFLNEIRDLLGEDPINIGQQVGNLFSNGEKGCNGYIDFNLIESTEIDPETGEDIPCFWIDPNVDGLISDCLEKIEKIPFKARYFDTIEEG